MHPRPSNRGFGFFVAGVALVIFCLAGFYWPYAVTAIGAALLSLVYPAVFSIFNRLWHDFGLLLGWLMAPIVLSLIYFTLFVPMALVLKAFGHQAFKPGGWIEKKKPCDFKRSF